MPRVKEFDRGLALQRALDLFWQRGYEATSIADLVDHLGIARASLYATFGSKHQLYIDALDLYLDTRDPAIVAELSRPGPALPLIRGLVERYVEEAVTNRHGCFVVNAAVECMAVDPSTGQRVERSWQTVEVAIALTLERAAAQGELAPGAEPWAMARFLLVLLQGIRVVGMGADASARIEDATRFALTTLENRAA